MTICLCTSVSLSACSWDGHIPHSCGCLPDTWPYVALQRYCGKKSEWNETDAKPTYVVYLILTSHNRIWGLHLIQEEVMAPEKHVYFFRGFICFSLSKLQLLIQTTAAMYHPSVMQVCNFLFTAWKASCPTLGFLQHIWLLQQMCICSPSHHHVKGISTRSLAGVF